MIVNYHELHLIHIHINYILDKILNYHIQQQRQRLERVRVSFRLLFIIDSFEDVLISIFIDYRGVWFSYRIILINFRNY